MGDDLTFVVVGGHSARRTQVPGQQQCGLIDDGAELLQGNSDDAGLPVVLEAGDTPRSVMGVGVLGNWSSRPGMFDQP